MKRKGLLLTGILAGLGAFALVLGTAKSPLKADASLTSHIYLDDNFNDAEFRGSVDGSKWVANGSHIKQASEGESFIQNPGGNDAGGECLFFGFKEVQTNVQVIQFDLKLPEDLDVARGDWIGVKFLKDPITISNMSDHCYEHAMSILGKDVAQLTPGFSTNKNGNTIEGMTTYSDMRGKWVSYRIEPQTNTTAKLYLAKQGVAFDTTKYFTLTVSDSNNDFINCQFGIQTVHPAPKICLDNFYIKTNSLEVSYTFETFDEEASILGHFKKYDSTPSYKLMGSSALEIPTATGANESLVSKRVVNAAAQDAPGEVKVIDSSFKVHIPSGAASTDTVSVAFGLDETNSALNTAGIVAEFSKSSVKLSLMEGNAQVLESAAGASEVTSENMAAVSLVVLKNGNLQLKINDAVKVSLQGKVEKFIGHFGVFASASPAVLMEVDDFHVGYETYYVPVTKSVTHNFSNNFWGNEGYEDFYIGTDHVGVLDAIDGKLTYERCADGAMFGSAHQYDCFILDYKLCTVKVGPEPDDPNEIIQDYTRQGKWSGLDLSREVREFSQYGRYLMLLVTIVPKDGQDKVYVDPWVNPAYSNYNADYNQVCKDMIRSPIDAELFRKIQYDGVTTFKEDIKEEDYLCFRWISYGDRIEFYLKTNSEIEFTKYATFRNIDLAGYFCLTCTGYTTLQYDDFSMANTSPIYTCANNEAPETIIQTETQVIYDAGNVDVNLEEEIKINTEETSKKDSESSTENKSSGGLCGGNIIASSILLSSLSLCGAGLLVIRKKGKKHEK